MTRAVRRNNIHLLSSNTYICTVISVQFIVLNWGAATQCTYSPLLIKHISLFTVALI